MSSRVQVDGIMSQLEELWADFDVLFGAIQASEDWGHKHGPDWTFADVPYHLAYFDRELIVRGLKYGPDYPAAEQEAYPTMGEVNAWNAREFGRRPAGQTAAESVQQTLDVRDQIRRLAAAMTDDDLVRPLYMPLLAMGWVNAAMGLGLAVVHNWSEFTQLRILMNRAEPVPSAATSNTYLVSIVNFMGMGLNRQAAQGVDFSVVYEFDDDGVSPVTVRVKDGAVTAAPGRSENADLVITQSAETFEKVFRGMQSPMDAMQSGAMRVSSMEALGTFGALFPAPTEAAIEVPA
jgi:putative sterol carrier protein